MQRPMLCMYRSEGRSYYGGIELKRDDPSLFRLYLVIIKSSAKLQTGAAMSAKDVQFTIRLNAETNHEATVKAKDMNITRAELIRLALDSYLTQTSSNPNPNLEKVLLSQLEDANEARTRSDTIIMQLSTQLEKQTKQIEDLTKPRSLWQRIFSPMPTT